MDIKEFIESNETMIQAVVATGEISKGIKKVIGKTITGEYFVCSFYENRGRISAGTRFDNIHETREYFYKC